MVLYIILKTINNTKLLFLLKDKEPSIETVQGK